MKLRSIRNMMIVALLFCAPPLQSRAESVAAETGQILSIETVGQIFLKVRVFTPPGPGPFPLAIVSHGSPANARDRPTMEVPRLWPITRWLIEKGYVVALPLRRGYGSTGGRWAEEYGPCNDPDYYKAGLASADDILSVVRFFQRMPHIVGARVLLVGWSAGGWGALAAASVDHHGVFAVLNFAGGRGGAQSGVGNCRPDLLIEAAARFGSAVRVPSLWLYSENDRFFDSQLSSRMFAAFAASGAPAKFARLPPFKHDGHTLFVSEEGQAVWRPIADAFLTGLQR